MKGLVLLEACASAGSVGFRDERSLDLLERRAFAAIGRQQSSKCSGVLVPCATRAFFDGCCCSSKLSLRSICFLFLPLAGFGSEGDEGNSSWNYGGEAGLYNRPTNPRALKIVSGGLPATEDPCPAPPPPCPVFVLFRIPQHCNKGSEPGLHACCGPGQRLHTDRSRSQPKPRGLYDDETKTYDKPMSMSRLLRENNISLPIMDFFAWSPAACSDLKSLVIRKTKARRKRSAIKTGEAASSSVHVGGRAAQVGLLHTNTRLFRVMSTGCNLQIVNEENC